ncbi:hypothetical protein EMQ25_08255 [Arsenicitalea aurantiaca]|uniref:Uncharacterized protein n=1 Tax=Arsenicitalea aurantiaca TaxID=1783274 RepID=A0A433XG95_9HYPH|nr:hypothetical protein [Arsenicitalea aurantiaca]RUT33105.1 hypothetical protein EMQ25_08255 [Arsenicitalea aurantiaca]
MHRSLSWLAATLIGGALAVAPAAAGSFSIVSMQYSMDYMVPHIHYEGDVDIGDVERLTEVYDMFVRCRIECAATEGSPTAVLTMNSPGGNYGTGLMLADFLRQNHIATMVERGMGCYSACAFAWLGGSGFATNEYVGTYIDRMIEPGGILGFHAPFRDEESLIAALSERSATEIMGESRNALALMIREVVKWNVDPEILHWMASMGPNETYDIVGADDYYLLRAALPPSSTASWVQDVPEAVKNACVRLLAHYERTDPFLLRDRITSTFEYDIAEDAFGDPLHGYRLSDRLFDVAFCAVTDQSMQTGDYEIGLYLHLSQATPMMSFFNRQQGWSSAGIGGNPTKRIMQRGAMNHFFLPLGQTVDSLDLPGEMDIMTRRFFTLFPPDFATLPAEFQTVSTTRTSRVSRSGDIWVFEQVGGSSLVQTAIAHQATGVTYTTDAANEHGFIRNGTYANGAAFSWFGLSGDGSTTGTTVIRMELVKPDGALPTQNDLARLAILGCGITFAGSALTCN